MVSELPQLDSIVAIHGKARAIVRQPGGSERLTLYFDGTTDTTKLRIKNQVGIEGGRILADSDSVLIYNRIEETARKIARTEGFYNELNSLGQLHLLEIVTPGLSSDRVQSVFENETHYVLKTKDKQLVHIQKENHAIQQIEYTRRDNDISRISYETYTDVDSYRIPRKITIINQKLDTHILLMIQEITLNPGQLNLQIDIPADITIERL